MTRPSTFSTAHRGAAQKSPVKHMLELMNQEVVERSIAICQRFRSICLQSGYEEEDRVPVVSKHDPSIRFTNSTISVMKQRLVPHVAARAFLIQPALRFRNMTQFKSTGTVSPYGCSFMAFGLVAPSQSLDEVTELARAFLTRSLLFHPASIKYLVSGVDSDLLGAGRRAGFDVVSVTEDERPFRHKFGMPGLSGRNANLTVNGAVGERAVANIIILEAGGEPVGVELAFGINIVLMQMLALQHSIWASMGSRALDFGVTDLMAVDALHSSVVLAMEGLAPKSRGSGGNYRDFLKVAAQRADVPLSGLIRAATAVAEAESLLRTHASPPAEDVAEAPPGETANRVLSGIRRASSDADSR